MARERERESKCNVKLREVRWTCPLDYVTHSVRMDMGGWVGVCRYIRRAVSEGAEKGNRRLTRVEMAVAYSDTPHAYTDI